jgi:hypothetical protein
MGWFAIILDVYGVMAGGQWGDSSVAMWECYKIQCTENNAQTDK